MVPSLTSSTYRGKWLKVPRAGPLELPVTKYGLESTRSCLVPPDAPPLDAPAEKPVGEARAELPAADGLPRRGVAARALGAAVALEPPPSTAAGGGGSCNGAIAPVPPPGMPPGPLPPPTEVPPASIG